MIAIDDSAVPLRPFHVISARRKGSYDVIS